MRPVQRLDEAGFPELVQAGKARLVAHIVLAVLHDLYSKRSTLGRNTSADHQVNGLILQDFLLTGGQAGLGEPSGKFSRQVGFFGIKANQLSPGSQQQVDLVIDVAVVQADGSKFQYGKSIHKIFIHDLMIIAEIQDLECYYDLSILMLNFNCEVIKYKFWLIFAI